MPGLTINNLGGDARKRRHENDDLHSEEEQDADLHDVSPLAKELDYD